MTTLSVPTIDAQTLAGWLSEGRPCTLLDVRPTAQHSEWAIPGSLHIDAAEALWDGRPEVLDAIALPGDRPVVTICAAGRTSLLAAEYLLARGYQAISLDGGMQGWSQAWNHVAIPVPAGSARVVQVRRLGKGCLSYLVGSAGSAAVIDPSLPVAVYRELARQAGWTITHVLETHIHADHLSRARSLALQTGARLILPRQQRAAFAAEQVGEGDEIRVGDSVLAVLATPGHTRESITYLLDNLALFTGDTLSLSGVGRPDLAQDLGGARAQSALLHASLQQLWSLAGELLVLPAHTAALETIDQTPIVASLAHLQSQLRDVTLSEAAFVERVMQRIPAPPAHYRTIIGLNEAGECPEHQSVELEAGANRCAVGA